MAFAPLPRLLPALLLLFSYLALAADAAKVVSYVQGWAYTDVASLNWTGVDIVNYAFAICNGNSVVLNDPPYEGPRLQALVQAGHQRNKKVVLSVGGWTHGGFSDQVLPANRAAFISSIKTIVSSYNLDGIDIDWEYPNSIGAGNVYQPEDTANLQAFLPLLRKALGSSKLITMAVPQQPWLDATGMPSKNLTAAAKVLNYVFLMGYDVSYSNIGPNAPYQNKCNKYYLGAVESIALWQSAGFPASKIVLGVPFYGYNYVTNRTTFVRAEPELESESSAAASSSGSSSSSSEGSEDGDLEPRQAVAYTNMQTINFKQFITDGVLVRNPSTGSYVGGRGYSRSWDSCSSTPFLRKNGSIIAYDDPDSIQLKGKLAATKKLYGAGNWAMQADYQGVLTAALRKGLNSV